MKKAQSTILGPASNVNSKTKYKNREILKSSSSFGLDNADFSIKRGLT